MRGINTSELTEKDALINMNKWDTAEHDGHTASTYLGAAQNKKCPTSQAQKTEKKTLQRRVCSAFVAYLQNASE